MHFPVYKLSEFPKEELFGKVVMVRFDSKILLGEFQEHQFLFGIALSTIKYLYKAGARVILVSSWHEECNLKTNSAKPVAGKNFFRQFLNLRLCQLNSLLDLCSQIWKPGNNLTSFSLTIFFISRGSHPIAKSSPNNYPLVLISFPIT